MLNSYPTTLFLSEAIYFLIFFFLFWRQRGFDQQWLSLTFSKAIFLGNGLIAIVAGLFANLLADTLGFGPVAPFDAAACFLAIGMAIILSSWTENYGDPSESKDLLTQFKGAAIAIASGEYLNPFIKCLILLAAYGAAGWVFLHPAARRRIFSICRILWYICHCT